MSQVIGEFEWHGEPNAPPTRPTGPPGMLLRRLCRACGYDLRGGDASCCPACGALAPSAQRCPSCQFQAPAWVFEECPSCGRPLDCTAENDEPPPFGEMDLQCSECDHDLRDCNGLRCPDCHRLRLLRLDFLWSDYALADEILTGHGLRIERRFAWLESMEACGAIWIRSNCWPSADWVLEAANVKPLRADSVSRLRFCSACGYDLRGIESTRCPECGRAVR